MVVQFTTGAKVSKKSTPSTCLSPQTQNLDLSLQTAPLGYHLHLNGRKYIHPKFMKNYIPCILISTESIKFLLTGFPISISITAIHSLFPCRSIMGVSSEFALAPRIIGFNQSKVPSSGSVFNSIWVMMPLKSFECITLNASFQFYEFRNCWFNAPLGACCFVGISTSC